MDKITNRDGYLKQFKDADALKTAFGYALDIRKLEIELYWKRAAYFWTFIAATLAGYVTLYKVGAAPPFEGLYLLSCMGVVLSWSWYLVNRGSKYWLTNWEQHVDLLEDEVIGPLYKNVIARDSLPFRNLVGAFPFSVSKVNQILSLFVLSVWLLLLLHTLTFACWGTSSHWVAFIALSSVTALFSGLLFWKGRTSYPEGEVSFGFEIRRIRREPPS
jgi:hypothetical protein